MRKKLPSAFYNTTTLLGMSLATTVLALIFFLYMLDHFAGNRNPYMGLITFVALPPVLFLGLIIALVGVIRTWRRQKRGVVVSEERPMLQIDFNKKRHRYAFTSVLVAGVFLMAVSAFGSYQAYEYTESVEFCGKVCHQVMKPEYVAYQNSPHARVACVECHIGSGADWYVRSKISGARQVYGVIANDFHRPIETPIQNLRPAQDTCEQCHWPDHFYSQKLMDRTYYLSDGSKSELSMLLKIGGTEHGSSEGIHAHMYLDNEISYISTDQHRQVIPYVEARTPDGKVIVYRSSELPITQQQIESGEKRLVDCIDCHNRPAHIYNPPGRSLDTAMANGAINDDLPEIKMMAREVLEAPYKTEDEALAAIRTGLLDYYKENYPELIESRMGDIEKSIGAVQTIFKNNYFPEMKTNWKAFPNNLDHMYSAGCFRCHDGKHVSDDGRVISNDCQSCHTILSQKTVEGQEQVAIKGLEFVHPIDIGDEWKTTPCMSCHGPQEDEEEEEGEE